MSEVHGDREFLLQCQCAGTCTIAKFWYWNWSDEPPDYNYEFYTSWHGGGWRWRIRQAYRLLFGKEFYRDSLTFSEPDAIRFRDFLTECIETQHEAKIKEQITKAQ